MSTNFILNPYVLFGLGVFSACAVWGFFLLRKWQLEKRLLEERRRLINYNPWRTRDLDFIDDKSLNVPNSQALVSWDDAYDERINDLRWRYHKLINEPPSLRRDLDLARLNSMIGNRTAHGSPFSRRTNEIVEEKKNKFLNVPSISFHYANKDQIASFYNDYFKEPTVASLVSEITGELSGEIKGTLPQFLESKLGSKDLTKWISNVKLPDTSLNGMFLRYQREIIKSGQVTLGIEEVEIELTELEAFDDALSEINKRFAIQFENSILEKHRSHLKEKAAERTLLKLEQATGMVLIEGRFKIEIEGEFYRCIYTHPVNDYLSRQMGPITISILIPFKSIEAHIAGNYQQSTGKLIPLRVYGQIWQPIDRKTQIWDLQLTPLAIY